MTSKQSRKLGEWICDHVIGWEYPLPTTDPAAAMEVFKKCAEKTYAVKDWIQVFGSSEDGWVVSTEMHEADAPTLELAICLFARKLFEETK